MLSKKQLKELRAAAEPWKGIEDVQAPLDVSELLELLDHIDKLQSDYTAQSLALKAAKAMQQAETERADNLNDIVAAVVSEEADAALYFMGPDLYNKACDAVCATIQPLSTKE